MNLNKKIGALLDNGFKPNFISTLNENKINFLFEKLSKKKETKEQETGVLKVPKGSPQEKQAMDNKQAFVAYENEIKEDEFYTDISGTDQEPIQKSGPDYPGSDRGEVSEKFESKAQQGLFWARCDKCKNKNCKWCQMAKEFSEKTPKKDYKKLPKKLHPEKTVKYKKKKTNEEFTMSNYFDKVASVYANNAMGKLTKEEIINKHLSNVIENNLNPTMKKRDLLKLIETQIKNKRNLNEDFYYDEEEIDEQFGETDWTEEEFEIPDRTEDEEPDWYKWDDEEQDPPRPRGKRKMFDDPFAPVIEPEREIKQPPKRETEPEWEPDFDEPEVPDEDTEAEPQAKSDEIMEGLKREFKSILNNLDNTKHKPINYNKF